MKNILASLAIIGFCLGGIANIYTAIKYFEFIERDTFHIVEHIVLNATWFTANLAGVSPHDGIVSADRHKFASKIIIR